MLFKTSGIVFKFIKYRETSIITHIFTDQFGLQSYIVNGIRSKKSRPRMSLFQPLTLLDLVVYHKENSKINRISEMKCKYAYETIPRDMKKSSIVIFLTEILNKTVRQETNLDRLYEFMENSMMTFDKMDKHFENFHLQFLIQLTKIMGMAPANAKEFRDHLPGSDNTLTEKEIETINSLINSNYTDNIKISNDTRRSVLTRILQFYSYEFENINDLKSINILKEVMG